MRFERFLGNFVINKLVQFYFLLNCFVNKFLKIELC